MNASKFNEISDRDEITPEELEAEQAEWDKFKQGEEAKMAEDMTPEELEAEQAEWDKFKQGEEAKMAQGEKDEIQLRETLSAIDQAFSEGNIEGIYTLILSLQESGLIDGEFIKDLDEIRKDIAEKLGLNQELN